MDRLLYIFANSVLLCIEALPLNFVARLGRAGGLMVYLLDARHRRVARRNLARCFPEKSSAEVRALVKENFRRIGESYVCGLRTASMTAVELQKHLEFSGPKRLTDPPSDAPLPNVLLVVGHFGNFEIFVRFMQFCPKYQLATTYRGLPQPSLNRLMQSRREQSGCLFFERRFDGAKLRAAMSQPGMMLGLLCDQDGGDRGLQLPFLGHNCSTSPAAAVLALRYNCMIQSAICYRVGLARWRIECGDQIPTHGADGKARSTEAIMRDVNAALEAGVRRDPANWFWVHNRWKRGRPDPPPEGQTD